MRIIVILLLVTSLCSCASVKSNPQKKNTITKAMFLADRSYVMSNIFGGGIKRTSFREEEAMGEILNKTKNPFKLKILKEAINSYLKKINNLPPEKIIARSTRANQISRRICSRNHIQPCPKLIVINGGVSSPIAMKASVVLTSGFIDALKSDDQLAFVIAHEFSHILNGDTVGIKEEGYNKAFKTAYKYLFANTIERLLDPQKSSSNSIGGLYSAKNKFSVNDDSTKEILTKRGLELAFASVLSSRFKSKSWNSKDYKKSILGGAAYFVVGNLAARAIYKFDRDMEYRADIGGLMMMRKAEYNPYASISFWKNADKLFNNKLSFFATTHPSYKSRYLALEKAIKEK